MNVRWHAVGYQAPIEHSWPFNGGLTRTQNLFTSILRFFISGLPLGIPYGWTGARMAAPRFAGAMCSRYRAAMHSALETSTVFAPTVLSHVTSIRRPSKRRDEKIVLQTLTMYWPIFARPCLMGDSRT